MAGSRLLVDRSIKGDLVALLARKAQQRAVADPAAEATVLDDGTPTMIVAREESFGPVVSVPAFDDPQEALWIANNTPYGLAATVWPPRSGRHGLVATFWS